MLIGMGTSDTSHQLRTGQARVCLRSGIITVLAGDSLKCPKSSLRPTPQVHQGPTTTTAVSNAPGCSRMLRDTLARRVVLILLAAFASLTSGYRSCQQLLLTVTLKLREGKSKELLLGW